MMGLSNPFTWRPNIREQDNYRVAEAYAGRVIRQLELAVAPRSLLDYRLVNVQVDAYRDTPELEVRAHIEWLGPQEAQPEVLRHVAIYRVPDAMMGPEVLLDCVHRAFGRRPTVPRASPGIYTDEYIQPFRDQYQAMLDRSRLFPCWSKVEPEAERRAESLLLKNLTEDQSASYRARRRFYVVGGDTGDLYLISKGKTFNISRMTAAPTAFCVVPLGLRCVGDILLAQKFALECDETRTLSVANFPPGGIICTTVPD